MQVINKMHFLILQYCKDNRVINKQRLKSKSFENYLLLDLPMQF